MKKIVTVLLAATFVAAASASQIVSVVWPFNIGSTQANYARALITEANRIQKDYVFVLENRPGAGSSIAANYVANHQEPAIMAATSSFFIRPNFFPTSSHNIQQFRTLFIQCAVPMVIVSKKYKNFVDLSTGQRITIGVSGLGTTTHLLTAEIKKKYPQLAAIPYNGTMEPIKDVLSGNLDMAVGFPGELKSFIDSGQLNVLGVSGTGNLDNMKTLVKQGFDGAESVINTHFLAVPKAISEQTVTHWQKIFMQARQSKIVDAAHSVDNCYNPDVKHVDQWFDQQIVYWRRIASTVSID